MLNNKLTCAAGNNGTVRKDEYELINKINDNNNKAGVIGDEWMHFTADSFRCFNSGLIFLYFDAFSLNNVNKVDDNGDDANEAKDVDENEDDNGDEKIILDFFLLILSLMFVLVDLIGHSIVAYSSLLLSTISAFSCAVDLIRVGGRLLLQEMALFIK